MNRENKKMEKTNVRFTRPGIVDYLVKIWKNKTKGATVAAEFYTAIRPAMIEKLKKYHTFTRSQLSVLIDIQHGLKFDARDFSKKAIWIAEIEDAETYFNTASKYQVSVEVLRNIVNSLDEVDVYFWRELIYLFWENNQELEKFLDEFSYKETFQAAYFKKYILNREAILEESVEDIFLEVINARRGASYKAFSEIESLEINQDEAAEILFKV